MFPSAIFIYQSVHIKSICLVSTSQKSIHQLELTIALQFQYEDPIEGIQYVYLTSALLHLEVNQ